MNLEHLKGEKLQRTLEELAPKRGQSQVRAKLQPRLYFQTGKRPLTGQFYWEGMKNGEPIRRALGNMPALTAKRAKDLADGYDDELALGRVRPAELAPLTVLAAFDRLVENRPNLPPATVLSYRNAIARTGLGYRVVLNITEQDIRDAIQQSNGKYATTEANFMRLRRVLASVASRERIPDPSQFLSDPFEKDIFKRVERPKKRYRSTEDFARAIAIAEAYPQQTTAKGRKASASRQVIADHFVVCAFTGLRAWGEVAQMRFDEIDFDAKTIRIPRERCKRKNRTGDLVVPLTAPVEEVLRRRAHAALDYAKDDPRRAYVFPSRSPRATPHIQQGSSDNLLREIRSQLAYPEIVMHSSRAAAMLVLRKIVGAPDHIRYALQDWLQPGEAENTYEPPDVEEMRPWADRAAAEIKDAVANLCERH